MLNKIQIYTNLSLNDVLWMCLNILNGFHQVMDGITATVAIRKLERDLQIEPSRVLPIMAMTAHTAAEYEAKCEAAGMQVCKFRNMTFHIFSVFCWFFNIFFCIFLFRISSANQFVAVSWFRK